ncbi:MAG TPA: glycosyltransferase family 9 protein [Caldithrix abyssi]|uniref:Glycosyltransferase family 9 protein n=1 Tax=Caldithrix abyssi TaxID=187145 RepID=A0A7V4TXK3_CALAY|nr:glycosyltransferase family 9 protein [Caldithrix abyssi]
MENRVNILILRLSSIGDVLLATPFIRQTRIAYPHARIDFVVKTEFFPLIRFNPHLNNIYKYDKETGLPGLKELSRKLSDNQYDLVFDLHNNYRTRYIVSKLNKARSYKIHKDKLKRAFLVYTKLNFYNSVISIPQRYLRVGAKEGIKDDDNGLELFWKDSVDVEAKHILRKNNVYHDYIVLAPGAAHYTKRWPIEKFDQLIKELLQSTNKQIILLGNKEERKYASALVTSNRIINLAGQLTLLQAAVIVSRARVIVTNDSGLMHLATAVNTPVVSIFGSTVKELGFFPYKSVARVHEANNLWCRPCSHIGRSRCPLGHFKCMQQINSKDVFNSVQKFLNTN